MFVRLFFIVVLNMISKAVESVQIDSKEIEVEQVADYTDYNVQKDRGPPNLRDNFLNHKKEKDMLKDFERLLTNNTVDVDGITHYEIVPGWKKAEEIEEEFKDLLTMKHMKYVYQRDTHWRTWREVKDDEGQKKIICYKCQSRIHENCTDCEGRGVWVIEDGTPPCPYELFSLINGNEICAANYKQLNGDLGECPDTIKYADLTKSCNNPIVTRWRFTRNYEVPGQNSTVICEGRDFCEIVTLYQIKPDYVTFRLIDTNNNIKYSRVMRIRKNFACTSNCGNIDLRTYKVVKDNVFKLSIASSMSNKKKRNSQTQNMYKTMQFLRKITTENPDSETELSTVPDIPDYINEIAQNSKSASLEIIKEKPLKRIKEKKIAKGKSVKRTKAHKKTEKKKFNTKKNVLKTKPAISRLLKSKKTKKAMTTTTKKAIKTITTTKKPRIGILFANNTKSAWLRKDTGYYIKEVPIVATTHKSKCKKLVERDMSTDEVENIFSAYYDSEEQRKKFINFY